MSRLPTYSRIILIVIDECRENGRYPTLPSGNPNSESGHGGRVMRFVTLYPVSSFMMNKDLSIEGNHWTIPEVRVVESRKKMTV